MGFWNWLKSLFAGKSAQGEADRPLVSLVLLLREPRFLDAEILRRLVNRAWGVELPTDDPDATEFVAGFAPTFMIQCQERNFLVHCFPTPYVAEVEETADTIKDLRLRKLFREHQGWLAVDLLFGKKEPDDMGEVYRLIGKLLAELADTDCLALYSPATGQMIPYDDRIEERLRGPDVLNLFRELAYVPVLEVKDDDPRMAAAVEEARRRWPEYVAAFESSRPGQRFAAKAPISDGTHTEFMWIAVTAIEGDRIFGTLENEPVEVRGVRFGSKLSIPLGDLNDWVISDERGMDGIIGGFTIKLFKDMGG